MRYNSQNLQYSIHILFILRIVRKIAKLNSLLLILTISLIVVGFSVSGCSSGNAGAGTNQGDMAPDFTLTDLDGMSVTLSDQLGSPVLLNFWATWCPPCRMELPYLQDIHEEQSGSGLRVYLIDIGESLNQVDNFAESNGLTMPILLDQTTNIASRYGISAIPVTFFVDSDGVIQAKKVGAFQNKAELEKKLESII
jgi:peroxiredoxin